MKPAVAALVALTVLAGCTSPPGGPPGNGTGNGATPPGPSPAGGPLSATFDAGAALPSGWTPDAGAWTVVANASAPSAPNVLRGAGAGGRSTLRANGTFHDFEATLRFNMISGDEGAGLSFRYTPGGDYRIIRYSVREDGWHYFVMAAGQADKRNEATVAQEQSRPGLGEWVTLRIRAEGGHVQAWHGDILVIAFTDPHVDAGAVGPFLRGSAVALFDDLDVRPLTAGGR